MKFVSTTDRSTFMNDNVIYWKIALENGAPELDWLLLIICFWLHINYCIYASQLSSYGNYQTLVVTWIWLRWCSYFIFITGTSGAAYRMNWVICFSNGLLRVRRHYLKQLRLWNITSFNTHFSTSDISAQWKILFTLWVTVYSFVCCKSYSTNYDMHI